jgi:putative glutamine amidotransferase
VAYGGTLLQHLPERFGHHEHLRVPGTFDGADHDVDLIDGTLAAGAAGETHHATKSHHHQGVDRLGSGLQVSGNSSMDDLPEAIEMPDRSFVLGVQWHPEADPTSRVVSALVAESEKHMRRRVAEGTAA